MKTFDAEDKKRNGKSMKKSSHPKKKRWLNTNSLLHRANLHSAFSTNTASSFSSLLSAWCLGFCRLLLLSLQGHITF
jgi:hypothetical protein